MADDPIVYRYQESKGIAIPGVPARSLTQADYDGLSPTLRRQVLHGGVYTKLEPKAERKSEPKADAGKDNG